MKTDGNYILYLAVTLVFGWLGGGPDRAYAGWQLTWSDEFNGASIDTNKWTFDIGTGPPATPPGWGNNELEYYTSRPQNAYVSNGVLHIVAQQESYNGSGYTSAKLKTFGLFAQAFGRFEFRAKLPQGQGIWPALWMMPRDSVYGSWPLSGEIDVMELNGNAPSTVSGTIHFGGSDPGESAGSTYVFPKGGSATSFHIYTLEWTNNAISWFVDNQLFETQTYWWTSGGPYPAPFDQPFYIIMNLAVGGDFVGNPNAQTVFPSEMQVDYVRVYDWTTTTVLTVTLASTNTLVLSWPSPSTGFVLQQNLDVGTTNWVDVTNTPVLNSTNLQNEVVLPLTDNHVFYRLAAP